MIDYNKDFNTGDFQNNYINIIVETPLGSIEKIEWSRKTKMMEIDRIEPSNFPEPVNYGFIPQTTGGDGDNLDAFVISDNPISSGSIVQAKIIGIMKFLDEGQTDDKIVSVPIDEKDIDSIADLDQQKITQISNYYSHYKDYIKPGLTTVIGWDDVDQAKRVIGESFKSWEKTN